MLFGDQQTNHLPEEVIEILVDQGIGAAQYEYIGRQMAAMRRHNAPRTMVERFFRTIGLSMSAASAAYTAWTHTSPREQGPRQGNIRTTGTSFYNTPWATHK